MDRNILKEKFYYCSIEIEQGKMCKTQCEYCKNYFYPLEKERKMEDLKDWVENNKKP